MHSFNPQNINSRFAAEAKQIAEYYKEKMANNINLGNIEYQITNSDFNVSIKFSEGYILKIHDDTLSDYAHKHISIIETLKGCKLHEI